MSEAFDEITDQLAREEDPSFEQLMKVFRNWPTASDDDKHIRTAFADGYEDAYSKLKPDTKERLTEDLAAALDAMPSTRIARETSL